MDEKEAEARPLMGTIFLVGLLLSSKKQERRNGQAITGTLCLT